MDASNIGRLLLRIMVGGLLLFHGIDKVRHGIEYIDKLISMHGLPSYLAYGVYVGEVVAPAFLLLGLFSRFWAFVVAFNMTTAIYLVHSKSIFALGDYGAWAIELPLLYLLGSLAIGLLGSGKYAFKPD